MASTRSFDSQQKASHGTAANPEDLAKLDMVEPEERANPEPTNNNMLVHMLGVIQGLTHSNVTTQSALLEVV